MIIIDENSNTSFKYKTCMMVSDEKQYHYDVYYRLYEFTDDICVLEENPLYPGLLNYVKTGLLTKEELIDVLEYHKDLDQ